MLKKTGRPTKLTPLLADQIVSDLETGAYVETAAEAAGINRQTLYNWLDAGVRGEEPYASFLDSVMRARAKAELDLLRTVLAGDSEGKGFGPAKAAAFVLERTRPNRYAQRVNMRVENAVQEVLEVVRGICAPEDFGRICERLAAADSEGGPQLLGPGGEDEAVH